jgi:hypothetical protein
VVLDFGLVVLFALVIDFVLLGALDFSVPVFALADTDFVGALLLALGAGFALLAALG